MAMTQLPHFIENQGIGCLCTSDEHSNPSGASLFYALENEKFYCITHIKSLKVAHIRKNPQVCFVIVDEKKYEQAQIYATAQIIEDLKDYLPILERISQAYSQNIHGTSPYSEIKHEGDAVVIELIPTKIRTFESGKGLNEQNYLP